MSPQTVVYGDDNERPCRICKKIDICDGDRMICYACWQELDLKDL